LKIDFTIRNPRAARHRSGLWDLGDPGSIFFKDLSLSFKLAGRDRGAAFWKERPELAVQTAEGALEIYQDSSGGKNWRSTNHVNRFGEITQLFRGFRVTEGQSVIEAGDRATPTISVLTECGAVSATVDKFWQNFPKAIEAHGNNLVIRLFPHQYNELFELQGGEQKTHTVYLQFSRTGDTEMDLRWVHDRLLPQLTPEWYTISKACRYVIPRKQDQNTEYLELVDTAIEGPRSFFTRREIIDEYGWRHFGDLYADHEAINHQRETPLVAHYNNQYDALYGLIVEYLRSGDRRWFELADDLARHVIDIDIYHTQEDRPAYNGGLFWHTDHYTDAGTAGHRAYSKSTLKIRGPGSYGGGPSSEHNYTTGLLHYYYLTGEESARQAVLSLADWVVNMDEGSRRLFGFIDTRPTGLASSTATRDYHGPGRGAANSINALLDAYSLTDEPEYLAKAESLILRCIHPSDDIQRRKLDDPEHRWSYLVFLQVLGKYLESKSDRCELDYMYNYAQASLLHYAEWMLYHEVPYATVLHKVDIPTETWPAQDIRKSVIFYFAAKHAAEPLRNRCQKRAAFFFQRCIKDLLSFPTCTLTRPIVVVLTNAYIGSYFQAHRHETAPRSSEEHDFGKPQRFTPQFAELYWLRDKIRESPAFLARLGTKLKKSSNKRNMRGDIIADVDKILSRNSPPECMPPSNRFSSKDN
jgi:hypothetical protein